MNSITHEEYEQSGAFFIEHEGRRLGKLTYHRNDAALITINHTEVDPQLAGQGAGRKMLDTAVTWARETNTKVIATCSYANAQFARDPSIRDVLSHR